jgi:hypothetical protein
MDEGSILSPVGVALRNERREENITQILNREVSPFMFKWKAL